jgi:hypothetical protein
MQSTPELVRCPVCGSKKIKRITIDASAETLCYCRGEGTVMESLIARVETLSDPYQDQYSDTGEISTPKDAEPQESIAPDGQSDAVEYRMNGEHGTAAPTSSKGLRGFIARFRRPAQRKKIQHH